jgi:hypothetical protein
MISGLRDPRERICTLFHLGYKLCYVSNVRLQAKSKQNSARRLCIFWEEREWAGEAWGRVDGGRMGGIREW